MLVRKPFFFFLIFYAYLIKFRIFSSQLLKQQISLGHSPSQKYFYKKSSNMISDWCRFSNIENWLFKLFFNQRDPFLQFHEWFDCSFDLNDSLFCSLTWYLITIFKLIEFLQQKVFILYIYIFLQLQRNGGMKMPGPRIKCTSMKSHCELRDEVSAYTDSIELMR